MRTLSWEPSELRNIFFKISTYETLKREMLKNEIFTHSLILRKTLSHCGLMLSSVHFHLKENNKYSYNTNIRYDSFLAGFSFGTERTASCESSHLISTIAP